MYLLDRMLLFIAAFGCGFLLIAPFHRWWKKHPRIQTFLLIFISQLFILFSPQVLLHGAFAARDNVVGKDYHHVAVVEYGEHVYSIASYDYVMPESDHVFTNTRIRQYEPWILGYYESKDTEKSFVYFMDISANERELIVFYWFTLADGSKVVFIENNLDAELESLIIDGVAVDTIAIDDTKYDYFIATDAMNINFFSSSIRFNGVEIGLRYAE
jgi:hypothetical protein